MKAYSQNGYPANDESKVKTYLIPGTTRKIRLWNGAPGELLVRFLAWFDAHIEPLDVGQLDDWGFAVRPIRGEQIEHNANGDVINLSNHSSGTAADANATQHGLGQRGAFTPAEASKIRAELRDYGGCIRWGGDYTKRVDEMHFEIVEDVATCAHQLAWLNSQDRPTRPEEDMALSQDDKTWIEGNNKKYALAVNKYANQIVNNAVRAIVTADASTDKAAADRIIAELGTKAAAAEAAILAEIDKVPS
jgi:hypothetical protein